MTRMRAMWALLASVGLHAIPLAQALTRGSPLEAPAVPRMEDAEPAATWAGETFDIDALSPGPASGTSVPPPSTAAAPVPESTPAPAAAPAAVARASAAPAAAAERAEEPQPSDSTNRAEPVGTSDGAVPSAGSFGQAGVGAVSAPLGKGLLRALPRVAFVQATFHELSFGSKGRLRFTVRLDGDGHPESEVSFDEDQPRVPWFESIVARAVLLLRGGTFAAQAGAPGASRARFELEFEVRQGQPASGDWLEERDLAEIGRLLEPTLLQPGRAHFRYNSGREVELVLTLLPAD